MGSPSYNQSQPALAFDADITPVPNSSGSRNPRQKSNRKKNFLSQSRERLDNFVGKISGNKPKEIFEKFI